MSKFLQITDIHIHGEYDGRFGVKEHFEQILADTKGQEFEGVILTGDLVDDKSDYNPEVATAEDYTYIFDRIVDTFGPETPILVIPGNHDNRKNLDIAYEAYLSRGYNFKHGITIKTFGGSFEEPGRKFVIMSVPFGVTNYYKLVGMDNGHNELPHKALQELIDVEWDSRRGSSYFLFVHKPLIKPFHRFMNQPKYSIDEDEAKTFMLAATKDMDFRAIFCGHYHCPSIVSWGEMMQYAAPSSQGQIDPFSAECVPSGNYPGYAIIHLDDMVKAKFKFIVPEVTDAK